MAGLTDASVVSWGELAALGWPRLHVWGLAVIWEDVTAGPHGLSSSHRLAQACSCDIWAGKCGRPLEG